MKPSAIIWKIETVEGETVKRPYMWHNRAWVPVWPIARELRAESDRRELEDRKRKHCESQARYEARKVA
jgi:hypothetical protein